ncbi:hypothetical protein TeGR_g12532, partial [Tetraparma gracilis]
PFPPPPISSYAFAYTGQESALARNNKEIGFYIRDLQRERDIAKKERVEAANKELSKKNQGDKKKMLLSDDEWAVAREFNKGRNLIELDAIPFNSWDNKTQDWVKKEHEMKEMRTRERKAKEERERKAREREIELEEQRERNGGKTDAEIKLEEEALRNKKPTLAERRRMSVHGGGGAAAAAGAAAGAGAGAGAAGGKKSRRQSSIH